MGRKLLVGTLLAAVAALVLVFTLGRRTPIYSMGVAEFAARAIRDEQVRVSGRLVHGTLCKIATDCGYRFKLVGHDHWSSDGTPLPTSIAELTVNYDGCPWPDAFRDVPGVDLEVVVEGERCRSCHDFEASQVMIRSSGRYELHSDRGTHALPTSPVPRCQAQAPRM